MLTTYVFHQLTGHLSYQANMEKGMLSSSSLATSFPSPLLPLRPRTNASSSRSTAQILLNLLDITWGDIVKNGGLVETDYAGEGK
jgi:hypothetical protein